LFANGGQSDTVPDLKMLGIDPVKNISDNQKSKIFFKAGIKELKENPKRLPKLFIRKLLVHWAPFENGFRVFNLFYALLLLLASAGILFFRKKTVLENLLFLLLFSTTVTALLTFGEPRYRYPYEPYLIIFAALAIFEIFKKIFKKDLCIKKESI